MYARERTERMVWRATLSLPDPGWVRAGGVASVADGSVGRRCWFSARDIGCSGTIGELEQVKTSQNQ